MDWTGFLDTAGRLAAGTTEGDWRSAISRGYYAVFHFFREWLESQGIGVGRAGQAHDNLCKGLTSCGIPDVEVIGQRIDLLRTERARADYNFKRAVSQVDANDAVQEATAIIADFQALLSTTPAATIAAAVGPIIRHRMGLPP
jgi:hypothetical protein